MSIIVRRTQLAAIANPPGGPPVDGGVLNVIELEEKEEEEVELPFLAPLAPVRGEKRPRAPSPGPAEMYKNDDVVLLAAPRPVAPAEPEEEEIEGVDDEQDQEHTSLAKRPRTVIEIE